MQMRLIVAPPARGGSIYRPAYLRGASGQRDRGVVLNVDRLIGPYQATVARQLGTHPAGLPDEILVDDLEQLIPEKRSPVPHQAVIGRVVTRQILKIVRER